MVQEPMEQRLEQWAREAGQFHLPRWQELPELELYMDQVIVFLEGRLSGLFLEKRHLITPAMVNNYVKLELMPKPNKKKYNQRHLAYLVVITLLKELFPIAQIQTAIQMQTSREARPPTICSVPRSSMLWPRPQPKCWASPSPRRRRPGRETGCCAWPPGLLPAGWRPPRRWPALCRRIQMRTIKRKRNYERQEKTGL